MTVFRKFNDMKTKEIITKLFLLSGVLILFFLHSCEKEDWCSDCRQYDCNDIFYEKLLDIKTICADSKADCREEIRKFHIEYYSTCWDCSEPYKNK
jgi:hypothetical protein